MRLKKKNVRYAYRPKDFSKRKCLVTIWIGNNSSYSKYTLPSLENYAKRFGLDFHVIRDRKFPEIKFPHFEILQLKTLLNVYDRIRYMDADMLIRNNAPNIFSHRDKKLFGCTIHAKPGFTKDRSGRDIQELCAFHEYMGSDPNNIKHPYISTGVLLVSSEHKSVFNYDPKIVKFFNKRSIVFADQTYLNYMIHKQNVKLQEMSYRWNSYNWEKKKELLIPFMNHNTDYFTHFPNSRGKKLIKKMYKKSIYRV
jgi:hypothetical protein